MGWGGSAPCSPRSSPAMSVSLTRTSLSRTLTVWLVRNRWWPVPLRREGIVWRRGSQPRAWCLPLLCPARTPPTTTLEPNREAKPHSRVVVRLEGAVVQAHAQAHAVEQVAILDGPAEEGRQGVEKGGSWHRAAWRGRGQGVPRRPARARRLFGCRRCSLVGHAERVGGVAVVGGHLQAARGVLLVVEVQDLRTGWRQGQGWGRAPLVTVGGGLAVNGQMLGHRQIWQIVAARVPGGERGALARRAQRFRNNTSLTMRAASQGRRAGLRRRHARFRAGAGLCRRRQAARSGCSERPQARAPRPVGALTG